MQLEMHLHHINAELYEKNSNDLLEVKIAFELHTFQDAFAW